MEVYKFSDSVWVMLQEKLTISPSDIRKININTATEEQLKQHPYIGEKYAASIIRYRNGLKRFDQLSQLRQVPLMTEEQYRKIFPYLTIE
jgi:competence ComEA-like helix-hairpin-helix protein